MMNEKADDLGLKRTHFAVAHGMHNDDNYSTALDMGKLACLMMKDERFCQIVKTIKHECISTLPPPPPPEVSPEEELKQQEE